jgi:hypothetical protein
LIRDLNVVVELAAVVKEIMIIKERLMLMSECWFTKVKLGVL